MRTIPKQTPASQTKAQPTFNNQFPFVSILHRATGCGFTHDTDDDTKKETDKELDPQKPIFLFNLAASSRYFIKTWEECCQDFIQDHDDWVHHGSSCE